MAEQAGIDNTKKFIADLKVLVPKIIVRLRDGAGIDDLVALVGDQSFRVAALDAISSAKQLPAEGKDLSLDEVGALAPEVVGLVLAILSATRGE